MAKQGPARSLMAGAVKCSTEGAAYGQCVLRNYTMISKDTCAQEFMQFERCVSKNTPTKK